MKKFAAVVSIVLVALLCMAAVKNSPERDPFGYIAGPLGVFVGNGSGLSNVPFSGTFNANQFAAAAGGTNIKSGALLTNMVIWHDGANDPLTIATRGEGAAENIMFKNDGTNDGSVIYVNGLGIGVANFDQSKYAIVVPSGDFVLGGGGSFSGPGSGLTGVGTWNPNQFSMTGVTTNIKSGALFTNVNQYVNQGTTNSYHMPGTDSETKMLYQSGGNVAWRFGTDGSGNPYFDFANVIPTGNGSGLTDLAAANLTGTINEARLPDNATVTGWSVGASTGTTPSVGDNDTSLATTAFVASYGGSGPITNGQSSVTVGSLTVSGTFSASGGLVIPSAAGTSTLSTGGQIALNTTDKQVGIHNGTKEVAIPLVQHIVRTFDPKAICDGTYDGLHVMTIGPDAPKGITITRWNVSFEADPTTEVDLDLKRADAFIGKANSAVMDVLDTTTGTSSETTAANINSGAVVANGKVIYLEFGTAYTEANHQIIFEMWYEVEED